MTAEAAADVQDCRRLVKSSAVVTAAVAARNEYRANHREPNLAAVVVAGEHQIDAVLSRPADIVRRVAEAKPKCSLRAVRQVGPRPKPRAFVADDYQPFAAHFNLFPGISQYANAQASQPAANKGRLVPGIVIAQHRKRRLLPAQPSEHRHDPTMMLVAVHDVASDGHQVGLPIPAEVHHVLIEHAIRRAAKVQIT